ncbi:MAG: hypothetical protein ACJ76Y_04165 [Thermoanaerobaculia bacterium]
MASKAQEMDYTPAEGGETVVTPWHESPLKTVWRKVGEDRYVTLDTIKNTLAGDVSPDESLGSLLVQRRLRRS